MLATVIARVRDTTGKVPVTSATTHANTRSRHRCRSRWQRRIRREHRPNPIGGHRHPPPGAHRPRTIPPEPRTGAPHAARLPAHVHHRRHRQQPAPLISPRASPDAATSPSPSTTRRSIPTRPSRHVSPLARRRSSRPSEDYRNVISSLRPPTRYPTASLDTAHRSTTHDTRRPSARSPCGRSVSRIPLYTKGFGWRWR